VLGQQVSLAAARTHTARLVAACGTPLDDPAGGLTHLFPSLDELASFDVTTLRIPASRQRTLTNVITALADGSVVLDAGADWGRARAQLLALSGIGPWTAEMIAMRGLGDPDAFPASDIGVITGARAAGLGTAVADYAHEHWRPWRSYAVHYLWAANMKGET
jgi:AraC family transcriptional regulator of adaptative response / DNA-3-methyladenine glycosylase II